MYPHDPLCDHIRRLLANLLVAEAWHKTVIANSPVAYKSFYDSYSNSPYAQSALKLEVQPKAIPLMQATHFLAPQTIAPTLKVGNLGANKYQPVFDRGNGGGLGNGGLGNGGLGNGNLPVGQNKPVDGNAIGKLGNGGQIVTLPANNLPKQNTPSQLPGKVVTLPAPSNGNANAPSNTGIVGKVVTLPVANVGKGGSNVDVKSTGVKTNGPVNNVQTQPFRANHGNTGIAKLSNNPTSPVQVNRPQFNTTPNRFNNVTTNSNFKQSMNQAPAMNAGMNRRMGFMH